MIKHLENEFDFQNLTKEKCLIDFYADWCGPCQMLGKVLEEMKNNLSIPVIKINTDKFPDLSQKMGVMSIPTLILMDDNKELKRNTGFINKDELNDFIK